MAYTFPASAREYIRSERGALRLEVFEGAMPSDLSGFVYVVAPTGRHVEDDDRAGSTPFLNGDGTVYRVELGASPELRWALTKPPCYWAERGAEDDPRWGDQRARDWGITRLFDDLGLGGRNLLNTALQAVRFAGDPHDRLLVTYESGRPFEVDPVTLEVVTPVGKRSAWVPTLMAGTPFEVVAATSHPAFDPGCDARGQPGPGTLFMFNFVRDTNLYLERFLRFLGIDDAEIGGLFGVGGLLGLLPETAEIVASVAAREGPAGLLPDWPTISRAALEAWKRFRDRTVFVPASARLLFWDGASEPAHCVLESAPGQPLELTESAHQMAVTANYVVVVDAAFKFEMDLVFPDLELPNDVVGGVRRRLSRLQPQVVQLHLVPREDIAPGGTVLAISVSLPCSCVHYFVDYDDHDGENVVVYAIDNASTDSSEFLLESDRPAFLSGTELPARVHGMMPCGVDVDRITRFEIHLGPHGAEVRETARAADVETLWSVALATGPTQFTAAKPGAVSDVYFYTHGLMPEAVSKLVWSLYQKSEYAPRRIVPVGKVAEIASGGGRAPRLCRYDATRPTKIVDSYPVPEGWVALSPQYVPGEGGRRYLVSAAFGPTEKEIWIFDASDLAKGPIAKLRGAGGARIPWAYTLHTTYLREAHSATGKYRVSVADDLAGLGPASELIDEWVIPNAYGASAPPPPPRISLPMAMRAPSLEPKAALELLARTYASVGERHTQAGATALDEAVIRYELDVLKALEPQRRALATAIPRALAGKTFDEERAIAREEYARVVSRIVALLEPLDALALPPALPEDALGGILAKLAERSLRRWAAEPSGHDSEARTSLVATTKVFFGLLRADPRAPEVSMLTRLVHIRRAPGVRVPDEAEQRRIIDAVLEGLLGEA